MSTTSDSQIWRLTKIERSADVNDPVTQQPLHVKIMNMLLPVDWNLNVQMNPGGKVDCANNTGRLLIAASSPDKGTGIIVFPAAASMWSNNPHFLSQSAAFFHQWQAFNCTVERPMTLQQGLQLVAPRFLKGTQVHGNIEAIGGLSTELPRIVETANRQLGGRARLEAEAGRLRITGDLNGKQVEAWLVAMQTKRTEPVAGGELTIVDIPLLALCFAPPGQLDSHDRLLSTVLSSVEVDPQHLEQMQRYVLHLYQMINGAYAQVAQIQNQIAADNARAAQQQAAIRANTANYASQVRSTVAHNRAAALDHSSQQFSLYMGDQGIYRDPSTGSHVQLSSGYNRVWTSSTGNTNEYILTDSPSFNPNGQVGSQSWVQMQEVH